MFSNPEVTDSTPSTATTTTNPQTTTKQPQKPAPEPTTNAPRWAGPLVSRPKKGKQSGHEYFVDRGPEQGALYVWRDGKWQSMDAYAEQGSFATLNGVRSASRYATKGTGTPKDPWMLDNVMPPGGSVFFEPGTFVSSGLTTPKETNFEETAIYLTGSGVRTTTLLDDTTDGSLITIDAKKHGAGNFGGVSNMSVLGRKHEGNTPTKGDLIYSSGDIIDTIYENLIVRYSWGHGMYLSGSASGTRIRNCWIENNAGWNLFLGGGTRTKLSNLHIISGDKGGIYFNPSDSQVTGVSMNNCSPGIEAAGVYNEISNCYIEESMKGAALLEGEGKENVFSNVSVHTAAVGIDSQGTYSQFANIAIDGTKKEALRLAGTGMAVTGLTISNFGKNQTAAIDVSGSDCRLSGISVSQPSGGYTSTHVAHISGDRNVLSDIVCHGTGTWRITVGKGASETVLDTVSGVTLSSLQDQGVRTLLNRQGTNGGDPRGGGEWSGHGEYAGAMGATVWDTRTTPWTPYRADGDGNWMKI